MRLDINSAGVGCIYFKHDIRQFLKVILDHNPEEPLSISLNGLNIDDETRRVCNLFLGILAFEDGNAKVTIENESN